jgi:hypothetical protein
MCKVCQPSEEVKGKGCSKCRELKGYYYKEEKENELCRF